MPFVELKLGSLEELDDGRVAKAFLHHLKRLVQDCNDRPKEKGSRTLKMNVKLTPIVSDDGGTLETEGAEAEFSITSDIPKHKSKTYSLKTNRKGQAAYSSNSPTNADQLTFDDVDQKTGKADRGKAI